MKELDNKKKENISSGFRKTGIYPLDQTQVIGRLPAEDREEEVEQSILDMLKELRYGTTGIKQFSRKRR